MLPLTTSDIEALTLEWLSDLGYAVQFGPAIAPGLPGTERDALPPKLLSRQAWVQGCLRQ
jgi:hypothetical protein